MVSNIEYDSQKIEKFWQKAWNDKECFSSKKNENPYYVLEMFPYPSGRIHMGHVRVYTLGDVLARYKRAQGYDVFHPMGWDSFGMPAENAAKENNIHPSEWTEKNISNMKTQLKSMGISYDWSKELSTCNADYIIQQQKIFIKLFESNLAYKKEAWANWDPVEKTVLANEQVIDGKGWRSGVDVEKKLLSQWFLAITKFAEPLLNDLEKLGEWPENVKIMQKNWIGKSIGAHIKFSIVANKFLNKNTNRIDVFTTRPDTIFGASFLALAPDHNLCNILRRNSSEIDNFLLDWQKSYTNEAQLEKAPKKGIFTGLYTYHPFTKKQLPVYIANFVLSSYGTGAIFGVPAHDQRDYDFASKYGLEIIQVVKNTLVSGNEKLTQAYTGDGLIYNSDFLNNLSVEDAKRLVIKKIIANDIGKQDIKYRIRDWCASRQRYWGCPIPIIYREDGKTLAVEESDLPITLPDDIDFSKGGNPLENHPTWKYTTCKKTGLKAVRETDTLDTFFDSSWYYLRFLSPKADYPFDSKEIDKWCPVHQYVGGIEHAVLHLLYSRFFVKALNHIGEINILEPFKGLFCQGMVCHRTYKDQDGKWVFPEDITNKGKELIHKKTGQKIKALRSEKMSKSKKNIVDPVEIIKKYGADTARIFMLSDSPPERNLEWSNSGIDGARKYIQKLWKFFSELNIFSEKDNINFTDYQYKDPIALDLLRNMYICIDKVTKNLDNFQYNVAVASLREFSNFFLSYKFDRNNSDIKNALKYALSNWVIMISPIIPHLAEELWSTMGYDNLVIYQSWPKTNKNYIKEENINLVIQINGKKKLIQSIARGLSKDEISDIAINSLKNKGMYQNKKLKKIIVIPDKVVNLVI
ncbi:leucine--tRNA ligase [Alphaproteobacteria bacterium]|nr:leucine--tRNA ligase [Alphaproteobacteria bacterium]